MTRATAGFVVALMVALPGATAAQTPDPPHPLEVLAQFTGVTSSEFQGTDLGYGALISWRALPYLGAEAETNFYPKNLTVRGGAPFSSGRIEALFGITAGPTIGVLRPFGTFRTGVVKIQSAPGPLACPAIFPPFLSCVLARGEAVVAVEVGGGVEAFPMPHAVVRIDLGDRLVHYPGTSIDASGERHNLPFYRREFRFAVGVGARF
jgi:hypothetical protein